MTWSGWKGFGSDSKLLMGVQDKGPVIHTETAMKYRILYSSAGKEYHFTKPLRLFLTCNYTLQLKQ